MVAAESGAAPSAARCCSTGAGRGFRFSDNRFGAIAGARAVELLAATGSTRFAGARSRGLEGLDVPDPTGNTEETLRDRLASVTDPLFRLTVYAYDAMSRRISVSNPAIQSSPLLQQTYTPDGLIASLTDANSHTTSFTSDGFDRLSTTTYPLSSTETLSYDADSNVPADPRRRHCHVQLRHAQ